MKQFLDSNGKFITEFNNLEEVKRQQDKVRNAVRQTMTAYDFDILHMYYQTLKHTECNIIMTETKKEWEKF